MSGNSSTRAKNKYNAANYDRINVSVKKGEVPVIDQAASNAKLSRNAFILEAIAEKIERQNDLQ